MAGWLRYRLACWHTSGGGLCPAPGQLAADLSVVSVPSRPSGPLSARPRWRLRAMRSGTRPPSAGGYPALPLCDTAPAVPTINRPRRSVWPTPSGLLERATPAEPLTGCWRLRHLLGSAAGVVLSSTVTAPA